MAQNPAPGLAGGTAAGDR